MSLNEKIDLIEKKLKNSNAEKLESIINIINDNL